MHQIYRYIHILTRIMVATVIAIASVSCIKEEGGETPVPEDGRVRLEIYTLPSDFSFPGTRATANEDAFDAPMVMVFKGTGANAVFSEASMAMMEAGKYVVKLTPTDEAVTLLLATNIPGNKFYDGSTTWDFTEANVTETLKGKTLKQAGEGVLQTEPPASNVISMPFVSPATNLPMSAVHQLPSGIRAGQTIGDNNNRVKLIRMVAKATVTVDSPITQNFRLNSIGAGSVAGRGYIYNSGTNVPDIAGGIRYNNFTVGSTVTTTADPVYIYETAAGERPFLLLRAQMNGILYYYPVPFYKDGAYIDVERNKFYKITITSAGIGYTSINDALAAGAENIPLPGFSAIITVNDQYSYDIVSNEDFFIGAAFSKVELYHNETQASIRLDVYTDAKASNAYSTAVTTDASGITATPGTLNYAGHTQVTITVSSTVDNGTVTLRAGSLVKEIAVVRHRGSYVPWNGVMELEGTDFISCSIQSQGTSNWLSVSPDGINSTSTGFELNAPGKIYIMATENSGTTIRSGGQLLTASASSGRSMIYLSQNRK